ncbi:uncharacterized protein [Aquarana catesbeiana]|uniref:uncharacterized protein isoform X2 n=1 Tax=Aquarana catesbeiana TaxID=8400 RepID=UPI003CC9ABCE
MATHTIVSRSPSTSVTVSPLHLNTTTKSSVPPSLNMNKQTICAKHLEGLTGIRWINFKLALCRKKPSGKAEGIKMRNLNDKSVEYVVESIFRCFTNRRGPGIIKDILKALNENEIRCSIERDIRKASEAMNDMQVRSSMGSKAATTNDYSVSSSGIPAKKMIRRDGDVPKQSHNTGQNVNKQTRPIQKQASQGISQLIQQSVNKKEGPRPAQKQPKPASEAMHDMQVRSSMGSKAATTNDYSVSSSGIPAKKMIRRDGDVPKQSHNTGQNVNKQTRPIQKQASQGISQLIQQSVNKKEGPRPAQKQPKPAPQPQVNLEKGNITKNLFGTTSNKQLGVSPSHISSNEPSQSKQPLPNISMEKKISNILAKHLKKLEEERIKQFKDFLCFSEPPIKEDKILTGDVKDKSVEDMVDLIIHHHTVEHVIKTIKTFLLFMKENTIKTLIEKDFRELDQQQNLKKNVSV